MPTTFLKGDLFEDSSAGSTRALAFAADCSGAMDRGVALAFKKRFGSALAEAYAARAAGGKMQLGDVFMWKGDDAKGTAIVYALGIQQADKKTKVSTVTRALEGMLGRALEDGALRIALPLVGSGKDGVDRVRIKRVLNELGEKSAVDLVVYEQFVRAPSTTE